jgi:hypothetical protein
MVIFGGWGDGLWNDIWSLPLTGELAWSEILPLGYPPLGLAEHTAILDPIRDRIVIFGGWNVNNIHLNDAWAFSFHEAPVWSHLTPAGTPPSPRSNHSAIYDPVRDRMVVFGGGYPTPLRNTWVLSLDGCPTWTELSTLGPSPPGRSRHTAIYDPIRDRMVIFGGGSSQVWVLSFVGTPTWSRLEPDGTPPPLAGHTAIYDPIRDRMLVFGGWDSPGHYVNDTWALSLSDTPTWSRLEPTGITPSAQPGYKAIYDTVRARMVIFGGFSSGNPMEAWELQLQNEPAWKRLDPSGSPPSRRGGFAVVYETTRDAMWLYGGTFYGEPPFNEAWELMWERAGVSNKDGLEASGSTRADRALLVLAAPNPARGSTLISFRAPRGALTTVHVHDVSGRLVAKIYDAAANGGVQQVPWRSDALPSGLYFLRVGTGDAVSTAKLMVLH